MKNIAAAKLRVIGLTRVDYVEHTGMLGDDRFDAGR